MSEPLGELTKRFTVLLGDNFSLDEEGYFGRAIANRSLLKALFHCEQIERILTTTPENFFRCLDLPVSIKNKLYVLNSLPDLIEAGKKFNVRAIFCSDFIADFPDWIDFRNRQGLTAAVYGWTHSLSYQRYTADIFRILAAGPTERDGILCTSSSAITAIENMFAKTGSALDASPLGPARILFPLTYETEEQNAIRPEKPAEPFQVLSLGRLDWQTKADLLVLGGIINHLPNPNNIRFVVAGGGDNQAYINLLQKILVPLGVDIRVSVSEAEKAQLYQESHVMFLPADNYQETFGLAVLEAKHHGCVPVVADWNGFRSLVRHQEDGILLPTLATVIPDRLYQAQNIVSEATYHGWWAAGVSIDPRQAAEHLLYLYNNRDSWRELSNAAVSAVAAYSSTAASERLGQLLCDRLNTGKTGFRDFTSEDYPGHWNLLELFSDHPTAVWKDQTVSLTAAGKDYLSAPYSLPQMALLMKSVNPVMLVRLLKLVRDTGTAAACMQADIPSILLSLALKNGLVFVKQT